jgi:hypothetical protein
LLLCQLVPQYAVSTIDQYAIAVNSGILKSQLDQLTGLSGLTQFVDDKLQNQKPPEPGAIDTSPTTSENSSSVP